MGKMKNENKPNEAQNPPTPTATTYCSASNGKILDILIKPSSKKCSLYEKIMPQGGVEICAFDETSRYSKEELEDLIGEKYPFCNADELAGVLILKLVKEQVRSNI
jgi:hypothetical protein